MIDLKKNRQDVLDGELDLVIHILVQVWLYSDVECPLLQFSLQISYLIMEVKCVEL